VDLRPQVLELIERAFYDSFPDTPKGSFNIRDHWRQPLVAIIPDPDKLSEFIRHVVRATIVLQAKLIQQGFLSSPKRRLEERRYLNSMLRYDEWRAPRTLTLRALDVPFQNEKRILRKDGQYRWFLIHYNPLLDDQGRVIRWYATGTDIDDRVQAEERTRNENLALREQIDRDSMFEDIVGSSEALRKVLRQVSKVASSDSTVLILGETGTGKELIARAIHRRSNRAARYWSRCRRRATSIAPKLQSDSTTFANCLRTAFIG
jgi:transcriptional regulator of acetoin/glycerol metabolism